MTILITGATGLIGQRLVFHLLKHTSYKTKPHKIRLLIREGVSSPTRDKFLQHITNTGVDIVWGDLCNTSDVISFTAVNDPENSVLIHCGAIFNFHQPYSLLYDINVNGTARILRGFHLNKLKKLVFVSSIAVYGAFRSSNGCGVKEDFPIDFNQRESYELTKSLSENLVWDYFKNNPNRLITVVRPAGVVGGQGVTLDTFARMFIGRYIPVPGNGSEKISLVDVKDVVNALSFFSSFYRGNGEAFNLVSFTPTIREFLSELAEILDRSNARIVSIPLILFKPMYFISRIVRFFKKARENSMLLPILFDKLGQEIWIDNSKIQALGLHSEITLTESMSSFHQFLSENPWYAKEKFKISF